MEASVCVWGGGNERGNISFVYYTEESQQAGKPKKIMAPSELYKREPDSFLGLNHHQIKGAIYFSQFIFHLIKK